MAALISYMYTFGYTHDNHSITFDAELCVLADQYDVTSLKNLAMKNCIAHIDNWNESFISTQLNAIVELVRTAYSACEVTRDISEAIVKKLVALEICMNQERLCKLQGALAEYPAFAIDLITSSAGKARIDHSRSTVAWSRCFSCHNATRIEFGDRVGPVYHPCTYCRILTPEAVWRQNVMR